MRDKSDCLDSADADPVRLGEDGWKSRYYVSKLHTTTPEEEAATVRELVREYARGLVWVMRYYYRGCPSWGWFFPFHYAPFASDLRGLADVDTTFDLGRPFAPFCQLMGVLPSASAHALPPAMAALMTAPDSPIADFYPADFETDMNGKRFVWQAVTLLPFIDEARLLAAAASAEGSLTVEERRRNSVMLDTLFVHASHALAPSVLALEDSKACARRAPASSPPPQRARRLHARSLASRGTWWATRAPRERVQRRTPRAATA